MHRRGLRGLILSIPFALPACAATPAPVETSAAVTATPLPDEVRFDLQVGDKDAGSIVLRSSGAYLDQVGAEQRTVIAVALEIENGSAVPISLDPRELRLSSVRTSKGDLTDLTPYDPSNRADVPPGGKQTVQAQFALPRETSPAAVRDYDLTWILREPGGIAYRLLNVFVQQHGEAFVVPSYESAPYPYYHYDGGAWHYGDFGPAWPHPRFLFVAHFGYGHRTPHGAVHGAPNHGGGRPGGHHHE